MFASTNLLFSKEKFTEKYYFVLCQKLNLETYYFQKFNLQKRIIFEHQKQVLFGNFNLKRKGFRKTLFSEIKNLKIPKKYYF